MRTRCRGAGVIRALSGRSDALQRLGCSEASSREAIRDAYYNLAKACHPDQGGSAAEFRALATAYECALRSGDDDDTADATPAHGFAADDPLAVYVRVERERAAALRTYRRVQPECAGSRLLQRATQRRIALLTSQKSESPGSS